MCRQNQKTAGAMLLLSLALSPIIAEAADYSNSASSTAGTCGSLKNMYKQASCCGNPTRTFPHHVIPSGATKLQMGANPCAGMKQNFPNDVCFQNNVVQALEQAGADVSENYQGGRNPSANPITSSYFDQKLCPVNVHWHLGAEHRSQGQYDEGGRGPGLHGTPANTNPNAGGRRLADQAPRYGFACYHYNANDPKFTTQYDWQHCVGMHVGETYEVHWPHSALGACNTPYQYQSPFYDGVFCGWNQAVADAVGADAQNLASSVGVQAQVFTIVNDESYYFPDLMRGAIKDGTTYWHDVIAYTGSTTGTSRNNTMCSSYTPITWQVDRKCHLISASTFDKMCADMKQQYDDMSMDLHAHGARELVHTALVANNQQVDNP